MTISRTFHTAIGGDKVWQLSALGDNASMLITALIEFVISFLLFVAFVWLVVKIFTNISHSLSAFTIFSSFRINNIANVIEASTEEEYVRVLPPTYLTANTELTPEEDLSFEDKAALRQLRHDIALLDITSFE